MLDDQLLHILYGQALKRELVSSEFRRQNLDFFPKFNKVDFSRITLDFGHNASVVELIQSYHVYLVVTFAIPPIAYYRALSRLYRFGLEILL